MCLFPRDATPNLFNLDVGNFYALNRFYQIWEECLFDNTSIAENGHEILLQTNIIIT